MIMIDVICSVPDYIEKMSYRKSRTEQKRLLIMMRQSYYATRLEYSVRAPPTPTPSSEFSSPTEMSTDGRNDEHVAIACNPK